jgi:hypothetical protein
MYFFCQDIHPVLLGFFEKNSDSNASISYFPQDYTAAQFFNRVSISTLLEVCLYSRLSQSLPQDKKK